MNKLASADVARTLSAIPQTLVKMASKIDAQATRIKQLESELNSVRRADEVAKIASEMHSKGFGQGRSVGELEAYLDKTDLRVVKQALELQPPQFQFGSVGERSNTASSMLDKIVLGS